MKELLSIVNLTEAFKSLPSIGEKTAERMAYSILDMDDRKVDFLVNAIKEAKEKIHTCENCGALIDTSTCPYCSKERSHDICIVVSYPKDILTFEKMNSYEGIYHVLNGEISSSKGKTIKDLTIDQLTYRIKKENIKELIIATNPTLEGETTALYIGKIYEDYPIKVSRLAHGIPMGSNIEYSDNLTLLKAIENRTDLKKE